jgi:hypothetical protein
MKYLTTDQLDKWLRAAKDGEVVDKGGHAARDNGWTRRVFKAIAKVNMGGNETWLEAIVQVDVDGDYSDEDPSVFVQLIAATIYNDPLPYKVITGEELRSNALAQMLTSYALGDQCSGTTYAEIVEEAIDAWRAGAPMSPDGARDYATDFALDLSKNAVH